MGATARAARRRAHPRTAPVAQVSKPAVSPISKSAGAVVFGAHAARRGAWLIARGFGNPRYGRLGGLRYARGSARMCPEKAGVAPEDRFARWRLVEVLEIMRWTKLKGIVLAGTGLVLLLGCLNIVFRPLEPHYDGKPLRYWVHRLGQGGSLNFLETTHHAMEAIGDAAVPWLVRWIDSADVPILDPLIEEYWRERPGEDGHYLAASSAYWRACALNGLATFGNPATNAVPQIIARLEDRHARVRWSAAHALERFPSYHTTVVPALIKATSDPDIGVAMAAICALQEFGTNAEPALPTLASLTAHHESIVRRSATKVLEYLKTNKPPVSGTTPMAAPIK